MRRDWHEDIIAKYQTFRSVIFLLGFREAATMEFPKVYSSADARKFLDFSKPHFLGIIQKGKIPFQKTSAGKIFFEPHLVEFQLNRFERAKTDGRIEITETQRKNVDDAVERMKNAK